MLLSSQHSVLRTLIPFGLPRLIGLSPQLEESARLLLGFPSLHQNLETLIRQQVEAIIGLTLIVSHVSGVTVLHCLMSSVLKPLFRIFCPVFFWLFHIGE